MGELDAYLTQQLSRLKKSREDLLTRRLKLQKELDAVDREIDAIYAYASVKAGAKPANKRQRIIELLQKNASGLSRREFLEAFGAKGSGASEHSVSNALAALKKQGRIRKIGRKYLPTD